MLVGNPCARKSRAWASCRSRRSTRSRPLKILVTGGSQGATVLGEVVPEGLGLLQPSLRRRLQVVQQCRPDDIERVRNRYAELGIPAELMTYIEDMPDKLADAHLVIGRAGASTIAELTAAGRPAILIPFPAATDDHQTANAREMTAAGGRAPSSRPALRPHVLARQIEAMAADPVALNNAAERRCRSVGHTPRATSPTLSSGSPTASRRLSSAPSSRPRPHRIRRWSPHDRESFARTP